MGSERTWGLDLHGDRFTLSWPGSRFTTSPTYELRNEWDEVVFRIDITRDTASTIIPVTDAHGIHRFLWRRTRGSPPPIDNRRSYELVRADGDQRPLVQLERPTMLKEWLWRIECGTTIDLPVSWPGLTTVRATIDGQTVASLDTGLLSRDWTVVVDRLTGPQRAGFLLAVPIAVHVSRSSL